MHNEVDDIILTTKAWIVLFWSSVVMSDYAYSEWCQYEQKTSQIARKAIRLILCDPGEARTLDPLIKSQLLYQLSYGVSSVRFISELRCKVTLIFYAVQIFLRVFCEKFQEKFEGRCIYSNIRE